MSSERHLEVIAHIRTDFQEKFGVPRQSGLGKKLTGLIVFTPKYRVSDALRGIEEFSHLWLIWDFSLVPAQKRFEPLVRPPRLGGNEKRGVFATRSPFRPNPIGLSLVRLEQVLQTADETDPRKQTGGPPGSPLPGPPSCLPGRSFPNLRLRLRRHGRPLYGGGRYPDRTRNRFGSGQGDTGRQINSSQSDHAKILNKIDGSEKI